MPLFPNLVGSRRARLARQAQAWIVRRDAGPLGKAEQAQFDAWLTKDGAWEAFGRAQSLWTEMDGAGAELPVQAAKLRRWRPVLRSRRAVYATTAAALAGCAVIAWGLPGVIVALQADARTGTSETRMIALEDGSRAILNTRSAIDIDYRSGERRIRLLAGEAAFEVAPDAGRPFVVEANDGRTKALGTIFTVRREDGGALVTAIRHRIEVSHGGAARVISPGQEIRYGRYGRFGALGAVEASSGHGDAWRRGVLIFENRPLGEIADELARYTDTRLLVVGAARSKAFSGVFRTNDPLAGLDAAAKGGKLRLTRLPGAVLVTAP